ncbi:hypothetical protein BDV19DRAFT_353095 [Aspergillus venezuelensis]
MLPLIQLKFYTFRSQRNSLCSSMRLILMTFYILSLLLQWIRGFFASLYNQHHRI